jgi:hypothetical protein
MNLVCVGVKIKWDKDGVPQLFLATSDQRKEPPRRVEPRRRWGKGDLCTLPQLHFLISAFSTAGSGSEVRFLSFQTPQTEVWTRWQDACLSCFVNWLAYSGPKTQVEISWKWLVPCQTVLHCPLRNLGPTGGTQDPTPHSYVRTFLLFSFSLHQYLQTEMGPRDLLTRILFARLRMITWECLC